ncbi:MAG: chloride channel protein [Flavobacteriales bacterium]
MGRHAQKYLIYTPLGLFVGVVSGLASALFLWSLAEITGLFQENTYLLFGLPLGGLVVGYLYARISPESDVGNTLIKREFKQPEHRLPKWMAPLVLIGTLIGHLFGASVGREGTAVQMGAGLADQIGGFLRLAQHHRPALLRMGVAGGFASVFGTPWAGAVFAFEFLWKKNGHSHTVVPVIISGFTAHYVCLATGMTHADYHISSPIGQEFSTMLMALLVGVVVGLLALIYTVLHTKASALITGWLPNRMWRTAIGGLILGVVMFALHLDSYTGLSLPIISASFYEQQSWFVPVIKLVLTALTLSFGFKGGEVTPLFMIGAAAGSFIGGWANVPLDWMTAWGMAAMFGAVFQSPFTAMVIVAELFAPSGLWLAIPVCFIAAQVQRLSRWI